MDKVSRPFASSGLCNVSLGQSSLQCILLLLFLDSDVSNVLINSTIGTQKISRERFDVTDFGMWSRNVEKVIGFREN